MAFFMPLTTCFYPFLVLCTYVFIFLLLLLFFFFLQVEVPPPTTGKISEEEVVTTSSIGFPGMEEEAPGGDITEEAR